MTACEQVADARVTMSAAEDIDCFFPVGFQKLSQQECLGSNMELKVNQ